MAQLTLTLNGHAYTIGCGEGEEERLKLLGAELGSRMDDLVGAVGQVGDARLLVMLNLLMLDEMEELKKGAMAPAGATADGEDKAAEILEAMAGRIEKLAARLEEA